MMNIIELDKKLDEEIRQLDRYLNKYDQLLTEAEALKGVYKDNTEKFLHEIDTVKNESRVTAKEISKLKEDAYWIIEALKQKREEIDQYITQTNEKLLTQFSLLQQQIEASLNQLDIKFVSLISDLEERKKLELLQLSNSIKENEKEIVTSRNEIGNLISTEVQKLNDKNTLLDKRVVSLDERLLDQKREADNKFVNEHSWTEKALGDLSNKNDTEHQKIKDDLDKDILEKYILLENKLKAITTRLYCLLAVTVGISIGLIILFVGR